MARKKIRKYPNREYYREKFKEYFSTNSEKVLNETLEKMGYNTVEEMRYHDIHDCWFDCGWVIIYPRNQEQQKEWKLDSDYGSDHDFMNECDMPYGTQSTTIKEIMTEIAIRDLGLGEELIAFTRLD